MEVILIIGIIFIVLLFLPKKKESQIEATNLSIDVLESQLKDISTIQLTFGYGFFLKALIKKYDIKNHLDYYYTKPSCNFRIYK